MCNFGEVIEARAMRDGIKKGEDKMGRLVKILLDEERYNEASRITQDLDYRRQMYEAYGI